MSCFGMPALSPSPSRRRGARRAWRWWRMRCAGLAAAIHSKIRRRAVRWPVDGRRRSSAAARDGWCHHRSFAPVYIDELYNHPKTHHVATHEVPPPPPQQQPSTSGASKLTQRADLAADSGKARARAPNNAAAAAAAATKNAGASGNKVRDAAAAATKGGAAGGKARAGARSVLMSPRRGVAGMGEVDLRAELFIKKFREEMRLQSQQSAEEFHAMLARGL